MEGPRHPDDTPISYFSTSGSNQFNFKHFFNSNTPSKPTPRPSIKDMILQSILKNKPSVESPFEKMTEGIIQDLKAKEMLIQTP